MGMALTTAAEGAMAQQAKPGGQTIGLGIPAPQASENDLVVTDSKGPVVVFSCGAIGAGTFLAGAPAGRGGRCGVDLCVTAGNAGAGNLLVTLSQPGNAPLQRASFEIFPGFYGTVCSPAIAQVDLSCDTSCAVTNLRIDRTLISSSNNPE
jgi:hypothetical protein